MSSATGAIDTAATGALVSKSEERKVIFASSLGTVFEWYDFYLYATLAPFFAALFFPPGNDTAALLSAFATYAAGFLVRPFGAIVFGRIGDLVGRKYTFLVTIVVMGFSTFAVGLLPTYATDRLARARSCWSPCACCRAWRSAASMAAPRPTSPSTRRSNQRGYATSWIQTTATLGFFLSLLVIGVCRSAHGRPRPSRAGAGASRSWSRSILLVFSVYIRLKLNEIAGVPADEGGGQAARSRR